ncbi:DUF2846 domain-containing protein [Zhongshania borealis]|uniref:DUF2846 domain-containing protein n=1 Tax=Zhongshania borealis TaxID=889488 RepID=A0ABP7WR41_9GAMM
MKYIAILILAFVTSACSVVPYDELNLDTTTNAKRPNAGMAGIYAYQWKSGILGAHFDARFKITGQPIIKLNTGEYGYFQIPAGNYEYRSLAGIIPKHRDITFKAGQNYFFRLSNSMTSTSTFLIRDQDEIDATKEKINSGWYELNTLD